MNLSEQEHYSKGALGQKGRQHSNGQGMADGGAWPAAGLQEGQFPRAMKEYRETRLNEEADSTREMAQGEKGLERTDSICCHQILFILSLHGPTSAFKRGLEGQLRRLT